MINTKERVFGFRTLVQTIRNYVFDIIYLKFGEYNHDKNKWEFKPLKIFRIKWEKLISTPTRRPSVSGFATAKCVWCPYNFFKITSSYSEWYKKEEFSPYKVLPDTWVKTVYLEKYLWQLKFIVVRTEKFNEDELLERCEIDQANMMAGYGIL